MAYRLIDLDFRSDEARDPKGKWTAVPTIHLSDLSTDDARRSPQVSEPEFQAHAKRGAAKYAAAQAGSSPATALQGKSWDKIVAHAFEVTREPWGGATIDSHSGEEVRPDADAYALTAREPGMKGISISPSASREEFTRAMVEARTKYAAILARPGNHLGVFHDADKNEIDIDPVLVTGSLADVHDIGAYTHAVGGAYHFKSGDGYWPPHVKE